MRSNSSILLLPCVLALVSLGACCDGADDKEVVVMTRSASSDQLIDADRAFARDVSIRGLDAWVEWFAEDGVQIAPGQVVKGGEAIRAYMAPAFSREGMSLTWDPERAVLSLSSDLGFTYGRFTSRRLGAEGEEIVIGGRYVTIWQRSEDGAWKVSLDTGVPDPPARE